MSQVTIIGAGIVGLSHSWMAAKCGHSVTVHERHANAQGATIRNFGMVWPIGQTHGEALAIAQTSRSLWLEFAKDSGLWINPCGSIHLAHRADELEVLREFAEVGPPLGYEVKLLTPAQTLAKAPGANPNGLLGGLWSETECGVNPRFAVATLARWLSAKLGVKIHFSSKVTSVESGDKGPLVNLDNGQVLESDCVVVATGSDFRDLFPNQFANSGVKSCKLQMLATKAQPDAWRIGPHLASGLTLRHYDNFRICGSIKSLCQRIAAESPELDKFGIHVMASQTEDGRVILGDSHEYGSDITPFDKEIIDHLILDELRKVIFLPNWQIAERWHGIYAKYPGGFAFESQPLPGVHVSTGTGGSGMTMSMGIADRFWKTHTI